MASSDYRILRAVTIASSQQSLFTVISDLRQFRDWSPWEKLDAGMEVLHEGTPGQIRSRYAWKGNRKVGQGSMTITGIDPGREVTLALEFLKPWKSTSTVIWRLDPVPSAQPRTELTRVSWIMEGRRTSLFEKIFARVFKLDDLIGKDFDKGLGRLKELTERA